MSDTPSNTASPAHSTDAAVVLTASEEYKGLSDGFRSEGVTALARLRLFSLAVFVLFVVPLQYCILKLRLPFWWRVASWFHRGACWIFGVRVVTQGQISKSKPVLCVANHISWLDILVLGGRLPHASFVAKSEIAGWGMAGFLASLQRTLFVRRDRRSDSGRQRDAMMKRLKAGHSLIMFPEGTSTDGMGMAPFKSALFSVAERGAEATGGALYVQPVTISYTETNGMPFVRALKPKIAWLGDVELVSHVAQFLSISRTKVCLTYHTPVHVADIGNRKALAAYCEKTIREGLERAHRMEYRMGAQGQKH